MAKRPRGTCRVCGRPWRARWQGDSLIVLNHSDAALECAGSGQPDAGEPVPQAPQVQTQVQTQLQSQHLQPRQSGETAASWAQAS